MATASKGGGGFTPRKPLGIFGQRAQIPVSLNWREVNNLALRTAFATALAAGATLSIAPASGGTGVTLRVYQGEGGDSAFAGTAEQLTELLVLIAEKYASGSEDVWQSMAQKGEKGERPS